MEEAIKIIREFVSVETGHDLSLPNNDLSQISFSGIAHAVAKKEIAKNGDYNLSGERYKSQRIFNSNFPIVELKEVATIISGQSPKGEFYNDEGIGLAFYQGKTEFGERYIGPPSKWTTEITKEAFKDDILMSVRAPVGPVNYATEHCCIGRGLAAIRVQEKIKKEFLFYLLKSLENSIKGNGGAVFDSISRKQIEEIKIPLPPLSIQEEIVAEIESYQKIIDGAKAVVENYKPKIDIDPDWEMLELDSVAKIVSGFSFNSTDFKEDNSIKCIKITNVGVREFIDEDSSRLPQEYLTRYSQYQVNAGDIVISLTRTIISSGLKVAIVPEKWNGALVNQRVACIKPTKNSNINFLYHYLCSKTVCNYVEEQSRSLMQPNLSITDLKRLLIPNPPIELQNELVAQIEKEESLANSNSELVEIFEQKIKDRIAKVWGEKKKEYMMEDEALSMVAEE